MRSYRGRTAGSPVAYIDPAAVVIATSRSRALERVAVRGHPRGRPLDPHRRPHQYPGRLSAARDADEYPLLLGDTSPSATASSCMAARLSRACWWAWAR